MGLYKFNFYISAQKIKVFRKQLPKLEKIPPYPKEAAEKLQEVYSEYLTEGVNTGDFSEIRDRLQTELTAYFLEKRFLDKRNKFGKKNP